MCVGVRHGVRVVFDNVIVLSLDILSDGDTERDPVGAKLGVRLVEETESA